MNIFATHHNPTVCARHHCDVHLRKLIVETAQLLSTTHVVVTGQQVAYRKTHEHHPCAVWLRQSRYNYAWTVRLFDALLDEYTFRFNKIHATTAHAEALRVIPDLPNVGMTAFAQAMPEEFRSNKPHLAYRWYLRAKLASWQERPKPMRTCFTRREVPEFLYGISTRNYPAIYLGVRYEPHSSTNDHGAPIALRTSSEKGSVYAPVGATTHYLDLAMGA